MLQVETLPQSMVDVKTIVLKPRLDRGEIRTIGERMKSRLFSRLGFKPNPNDIKLLASEEYFEPYFVIGGKYVLDYCKKHVIRANVDEKTTRLYVAGQEVNPKYADPKATNRTLEITGEEHAHYEKQAYYILDRLNREIPPERLLLSPFNTLQENSSLNFHLRKMHFSDEKQIDFLRTKIATRPSDMAEIVREVFDITDRTIAYYPMYQLTFENVKNRKEAIVTIDGITAETILGGTRDLTGKTITASQASQTIESELTEPAVNKGVQTDPPIENALGTVPSSPKDETEASVVEKENIMPPVTRPREHTEDRTETHDEVAAPITESVMDFNQKEITANPSQPRVTVVCEEDPTAPNLEVIQTEVKDDEIPTEENHFNESQTIEPALSEERTEPVSKGAPLGAKDEVKIPPKEEHPPVSRIPETILPAEVQTEAVRDIVSSTITENEVRYGPEKEQTIETQHEAGETMVLGFPAKISGETFTVGDNVTAIVGDIEIPSGINVNKTLVVKGSLKIGDNCKVHGKLKALKDVTVGADTIIDGNLVSGANIQLGPRVLITGSLTAAGCIKMGEKTIIEQGLGSEPSGMLTEDIQLEVDIENVVSVAHET